MNKKLILIILSAVLAFALIVTGTVLIMKNTGDCTVVAGSETAIAGDSVNIPIRIQKNCGIWGGQIIINYDSNTFNFVSCQNGEVFDECDYNDIDGELVLLVNESMLENTKENGDIAVIRLAINESADKGEYEIAFNAETNFSDSEGELVEPVLQNGVVTIK